MDFRRKTLWSDCCVGKKKCSSDYWKYHLFGFKKKKSNSNQIATIDNQVRKLIFRRSWKSTIDLFRSCGGVHLPLLLMMLKSCNPSSSGTRRLKGRKVRRRRVIRTNCFVSWFPSQLLSFDKITTLYIFKDRTCCIFQSTVSTNNVNRLAQIRSIFLKIITNISVTMTRSVEVLEFYCQWEKNLFLSTCMSQNSRKHLSSSFSSRVQSAM